MCVCVCVCVCVCKGKSAHATSMGKVETLIAKGNYFDIT